MPVTPTYPGVYVEEIASGVRTITGVATSIAAFVDYFARGPMNQAVQIFNMGDFVREFGGLDRNSEASYAVQQFFLNGGGEAWVVRTATGTVAAPLQTARAALMNAVTGGGIAFTVEAVSEGTWGNNLRARVDYLAADPATEFNLLVAEYETANGAERVVRSELFRNLSMDAALPSFAPTVVNDANTGSKLVQITGAAAGAARPVPNGTLSGDLSTFPVAGDFPIATPSVTVTFGGETGTAVMAAKPANLQEARTLLESAIRAAKPDVPAFAEASVQIAQNQLYVLAGPSSGAPRTTLVFAAPGADAGAVTALKLNAAPGAAVNVQEYTLGYNGARVAALGAGTAASVGANGLPPDGAALIGDLNAKTGLFALEEVDLFNLLCIPRTAVTAGTNALTATTARAVLTAAESYCEKRRAFLLVDTPTGIDEPQEIKNWLSANATLRHKNAALYYPRVRIPDPLDDFRLRSVGASGTIAGLYARIDAERGVWKAPAGTEATLRNVAELEDKLSDPENGTLNPLGINCERSFPIYGNVCWGARTLVGSDQMASEWKYVPVRRLALMLEESLYRGTQWVVFEPNDEPFWAQIRLNVGAFMHNLFRQGAFQGQTPRQAYLVKCDAETTTQNDINLGIVNIVVGFAPLKPAEFVILKIQQLAGQIVS